MILRNVKILIKAYTHMNLFKLFIDLKYFKIYISFFFIFFFMSNLLVAKSNENKFLNKSRQEENKLKEFYSLNAISYSEHDNFNNQLKMYFGFDPENPETSFYPDLSIIDDADYVRDMYKLKLNDMTIKK